mmetsp:Transcript_8175/g.13201  ORF Transcript_8175/g.13201 Transcript_8175/m.13201 type:complete len:424 (-) Transcript_8175:164-1435(-)
MRFLFVFLAGALFTLFTGSMFLEFTNRNLLTNMYSSTVLGVSRLGAVRSNFALRNVSFGNDPFDSFKIVGYPDHPLSLGELKMCDNKTQARLPRGNEYICPEDPTCKKCINSGRRKKMTKVKKKLVSVFRSKRGQAKRAARFQEKFSFLDENGVRQKRQVVVVGINYGQIHFFLNWACSARKVGLEPTDFVYVLPTDTKTTKILAKHGFATEPLGWMKEAGVSIGEKFEGNNIGPHAIINFVISLGAEALVLEDYPTILMDVDMVWLKNPFEMLRSASARRDVIASHAPRNDAFGFVNTGLVYFIPTNKTKILVSTFVNLSVAKQGSDQITMNMLLRHYMFRHLALSIVPINVFHTNWNLKQLKKTLKREDPYTVHMVSSSKSERYQSCNLWSLDKQCIYFDREILVGASRSIDPLNLTLIDM